MCIHLATIAISVKVVKNLAFEASNDTCVIETMAGKVKMERSFVSHEMSKQRATPAKK